ncbi:MAG: hypothetical protein HY961_13795 [Ignavibacteriae bacterium]|nr:hypothetical protein [Ignavibacteriota bacterium]
MRSTFLVIALTLLHSAHADDYRGCFPQTGEVSGWTRIDSVRTYEADALYDLIDGGADVFFEYGFHRAAAATYSTDSLRRVTVEVYEMTSSESAFGVFSMFASDAQYAIDAGDSAVGGEYFVFAWRGRFFISLTSDGNIAQRDSSVLALVRWMTRHLAGGARKPALIEALEREQLASHLVYIRGPLVYRSRSPFALRKLPPFIDGVIGKDVSLSFVLLRFKDDIAAGTAKESIIEQIGLTDAAAMSQHSRVAMRVLEISNCVVIIQGRDSPDAEVRRLTRIVDSVRSF